MLVDFGQFYRTTVTDNIFGWLSFRYARIALVQA
jgi:hypothetical protein